MTDAAGGPGAAAPGAASISALMEEATSAALPVLRGVRDEQLGQRTPCTDYDLRALLNHLFQVVVAFQDPDGTKQVDPDHTPDRLGEYGGQWPDRFAEEAARLAGTWAAPGVEGARTGAMGLPGRTVGGMALLDLTLHAWDAARASGQDYAPPERCVTELRALVAELAPTARKMSVLGGPVDVPAGAPPFDKLLAESGRDPRWPA
ncbi:MULTISPECIES: TIGR03086 family metal-binding protein [unclassified Streptomyces]|uniref:TIGR03086 family metal-binding protein n=1 Tax=unclassified Streptomyces TaxID=2593676 RepID=UPI0038255905